MFVKKSNTELEAMDALELQGYYTEKFNHEKSELEARVKSLVDPSPVNCCAKANAAPAFESTYARLAASYGVAGVGTFRIRNDCISRFRIILVLVAILNLLSFYWMIFLILSNQFMLNETHSWFYLFMISAFS